MDFPPETKTVTVRAGTKRRRYGTVTLSSSSVGALSRRVSRLSKSLKASNPMHMLNLNPVAAITNISNTGSINDLGAAIIQGDDFDQRFGSHVDIRRMNFYVVFGPGTTSAAAQTVRVTLFKAQSGLAFATNMQGSYNPVVDSTVVQLIKDQFIRIAPTSAALTFPSILNWSIKLNHRQKFTGPGASTTTAECLYLLVQSNAPPGTTAPVIVAGKWEVFFKP